MRGAVLYFSGTGNTEFVAKQFKKGFEERSVQCSLVDVTRKKVFKDDYDFLVFGSPIHAVTFPDIFMEWVSANIKGGWNRDAIVFSTFGAKSGTGSEILSGVLLKLGFNIRIQYEIEMPNNYFVEASEKPSREQISALKAGAVKRVKELVEGFLKGESIIQRSSITGSMTGKADYEAFNKYSKDWAQKNLSIDMEVCVRCGKCVKNCPTKNISFREEFVFKDKCISCQKCIHACPVNAFLYKDKKIEQYKL